MLPVFLALYIVAFSMGIAILAMSILSYQRSGQVSFKYFSILFSGVIILLLVDALKLYERAFMGVFGGMMPLIAVLLSATGNAIMGYTVPGLVFNLVDLEISRIRGIIHFCIAAVLSALGALGHLAPATFLPTVDGFGMSCLLGYGIVVLFLNFGRILSPRLKDLVRSTAIYASVMVALVLAQLVVETLPRAPVILRDYGVTKVAFYLGAVTLFFVYGLRYLFKTEINPACVLPDQFVEKYSISPRECEIISMIVQGFSNRKIGETLFISALTVKNHIYHIYQKTGAENKIQLLNLINSLK